MSALKCPHDDTSQEVCPMCNESLRRAAKAFEDRHPRCTMWWHHGVARAVYSHDRDCRYMDEHAPPGAP